MNFFSNLFSKDYNKKKIASVIERSLGSSNNSLEEVCKVDGHIIEKRVFGDNNNLRTRFQFPDKESKSKTYIEECYGKNNHVIIKHRDIISNKIVSRFEYPDKNEFPNVNFFEAIGEFDETTGILLKGNEYVYEWINLFVDGSLKGAIIKNVWLYDLKPCGDYFEGTAIKQTLNGVITRSMKGKIDINHNLVVGCAKLCKRKKEILITHDLKEDNNFYRGTITIEFEQRIEIKLGVFNKNTFKMESGKKEYFENGVKKIEINDDLELLNKEFINFNETSSDLMEYYKSTQNVKKYKLP